MVSHWGTVQPTTQSYHSERRKAAVLSTDSYPAGWGFPLGHHIPSASGFHLDALAQTLTEEYVLRDTEAMGP